MAVIVVVVVKCENLSYKANPVICSYKTGILGFSAFPWKLWMSEKWHFRGLKQLTAALQLLKLSQSDLMLLHCCGGNWILSFSHIFNIDTLMFGRFDVSTYQCHDDKKKTEELLKVLPFWFPAAPTTARYPEMTVKDSNKFEIHHLFNLQPRLFFIGIIICFKLNAVLPHKCHHGCWHENLSGTLTASLKRLTLMFYLCRRPEHESSTHLYPDVATSFSVKKPDMFFMLLI